MLRSESCDGASILRLMQTGRFGKAGTGPSDASDVSDLSDPSDVSDDRESSTKAARGFASVLYSQLFQEMQRTIPEQEDEDEEDTGGIEGAQDFLGMYLPMVISDQHGDPLSKNIEEYLKTQHGETRNERD